MTSPTDLTPSIPERVYALEVGHEVQATILTQIQAELIESDRLISSVGRLAEGSDALTAALLKVDATAQATTNLGKQLKRVQEESSTTEEIEVKVEEAKTEAARVATEKAEAESEVQRKARRRLATRIGAILAFTALVLGGMLAFTINSDHKACLQRKSRLDIHIQLYNDIANLASDPTGQRIREGAEALDRTRVNCDELYPIYWGDHAPSR